MSFTVFKEQIYEKYRTICIRYPRTRRFFKYIFCTIICPILLPCICCCYFCLSSDRIRDGKRGAEQREMSRINQRQRVRALNRRKRSPSVDRKPHEPACSQDQSLLFSSLPAEIRLQIYKILLAETGRLHICSRLVNSWPNGRTKRSAPILKSRYLFDQLAMGARICNNPNEFGCRSLTCMDKAEAKEKLGILLTCRRIYWEAIDLLYSENTFSFRCPVECRAFLSTVVPKRLSVIRQIVFEMDPEFLSPVGWGDMVQSLTDLLESHFSAMTSLDKIIISMDFTNPEWCRQQRQQHILIIPRLISEKSPKDYKVYVYLDMSECSHSGKRISQDTSTGRLMFRGQCPIRELVDLSEVDLQLWQAEYCPY
ncbi:hypothetical protein B0J11DRAFT_142933 [Dendryphion nanum]|uniref:DUF7730 domain-containing protein n=1 Tax=Dendryphion nanum TaxID=256645 RepID=A0A9P9D7L1_9PLEO|nr:hypothetical protein B0J11DRAFT_142933 [Dendryphion nanum]